MGLNPVIFKNGKCIRLTDLTNEELEQAIIDQKLKVIIIGFALSILIVALTILLSYN